MAIKYHHQEKNFIAPAGNELSVEEAAEWSDHARANGIKNDLTDEARANLPRALALLEAMYEALGCDAVVTSFYRGPVLNASVGGKVAPPSAHLTGRAVDSQPVGVTVEEAFGILREKADDLDYDQLIIEHDSRGNIWLHGAVAQEGHEPRKMAFSLAKDITDRKQAG